MDKCFLCLHSIKYFEAKARPPESIAVMSPDCEADTSSFLNNNVARPPDIADRQNKSVFWPLLIHSDKSLQTCLSKAPPLALEPPGFKTHLF